MPIGVSTVVVIVYPTIFAPLLAQLSSDRVILETEVGGSVAAESLGCILGNLNCRNTVHTKYRKPEYFGCAAITHAEVGNLRVQILGAGKYGGFVLSHVDPLKLLLVLDVKQSYR